MSAFDSLPTPDDARIAKQRGFLVSRINAVWRKPEDGLETEVRLIATRGGVELGLRSLDTGDTPVSLANWALDEAHEFMLSGGIDQVTNFDLRIGPAVIKFPVYPDNVTSGTNASEMVLQQVLQHNESQAALFFEATQGILKNQGETIKAMSEALATKDAAISKVIADQLAMAQTYASILDTKYQRDLEQRQADRKEARYDLASTKILGMFDGLSNLGGSYLMQKAQKSLEEGGNVIDKLVELMSDDERKLFAVLFARVQQRAQGQATPPLIQTSDAPAAGAPPAAPVNGAAHS